MKWFESPLFANVISIITFLAGITVTIWFNRRMLRIEKARDKENELTQQSASIAFGTYREGRQVVIRISNNGAFAASLKEILFGSEPFQNHPMVINKSVNIERIESGSFCEIRLQLFKGPTPEKITVKYTDGTNLPKEAIHSLNLNV
jgi:hypothetical protein